MTGKRGVRVRWLLVAMLFGGLVAVGVPATPAAADEPADLKVTVSISALPLWDLQIPRHNKATVTISVTNTGPGTVPAGWMLNYTVSPNLEITTGDADCPPATPCVMNTPLPPNEVAKHTVLSLAVRGLQPGLGTVTASVAPPAGVSDPNPANNVHTDEIDINSNASVGGVVWWDTNGDGVRDPGEPLADGVQVVLRTITDEEFGPRVTGSAGTFLFRNLDTLWGYYLYVQDPDYYMKLTKYPHDHPATTPGDNYGVGPGWFSFPETVHNQAEPPDRWFEVGIQRGPRKAQLTPTGSPTTTKPTTGATAKPTTGPTSMAPPSPAPTSGNAAAQSVTPTRQGGSQDDRRIADTGAGADPALAGLGLAFCSVGAVMLVWGRRRTSPAP